MNINPGDLANALQNRIHPTSGALISSSRIMPVQKPHRSEQSVETPEEFIRVVERRFGKLMFDLAASAENTKCEKFYSEVDNSLSQDWNKLEGNLWLNPPYSDIGKWARKCAQTNTDDGRNIFLLVPASIGSNWFRDYIWEPGNATVLAVSPRLKFVGHTSSYPKDLILVVYGDEENHYFDTWKWK